MIHWFLKPDYKTVVFITVFCVIQLSESTNSQVVQATESTSEVTTYWESSCGIKTDLHFWRDLSQGVDVSLNSENAICSVGVDCARANENDGTIEEPPIVLDLQEGDWLKLKLVYSCLTKTDDGFHARLVWLGG
ncbi:uncharacterized protein LOC143257797 [Tachypleus tridentatus]|uniref:uncharacterized protein LOC143257797 n=1 Tax=Tachypleus tridentatus TaxID=6853 RepID=UPI003FD43089